MTYTRMFIAALHKTLYTARCPSIEWHSVVNNKTVYREL